jgi:hypothetical protein
LFFVIVHLPFCRVDSSKANKKAGEPQNQPCLNRLTGYKPVVPIFASADFNRNCLKSNILPRFPLTCVPETDRIFA